MPTEPAAGRTSWLARTLLDLATPMLPSYPPLAAEEQRVVAADLAAHLHAQIGAMAAHLRYPLLGAIVALHALTLLRHGRSFRHLRHASRQRVVGRWSRSRMPPLRDLVKLIRSCALFAYLDHPLVRARLDELPRPAGTPYGVRRVGS